MSALEQKRGFVFRQMLVNSRRVNRLVWRGKRGFVIGLAVLFLALSTTPFLLSGSRGLLINELVRSAGMGALTLYLFSIMAAMVAVALLPAFLYAFQNYLSRLLWFFLEEKFELLIAGRKAAIDMASHEDPAHNDLFNKIKENGIWRIQNFTDRQFYLFQNLLEVAIATTILALAQWWVFLIVLLGTVPELIIEARYGYRVWNIHTAKAEIKRRFWDVREHFDKLPSLIELKLFQNTGQFLAIIRELFRTFRTEERQNERQRLLRQLLALGLSQAVQAFAMVWFIVAVVDGRLLIGTLTFFLASIADMRQALSGLFSNLGRHYQDSLFVTDVFRLIDLKPALPRPKPSRTLPANATPVIAFHNVTFRYPGAAQPALKNFSLVIEPGEKLALVGANGAGKTTLVKLLCRFYDPTAGRITLNGLNLKRVDLTNWYNILGVLFQDYARYHFLAKEAIALGRTARPLSLRQVKIAARASQADSFIEAWPGGYDQMLGKEFAGGLEPSHGQWQKLALSRVFYRQARVLILDEPTAAIDAEAEANIFEKLEALPKDRTVILISHRFSTVRRADRIIVLKHGEIAEQGTHNQLLARRGLYARLFSIQAKGYR